MRALVEWRVGRSRGKPAFSFFCIFCCQNHITGDRHNETRYPQQHLDLEWNLTLRIDYTWYFRWHS